jgi:hypothetical protein
MATEHPARKVEAETAPSRLRRESGPEELVELLVRDPEAVVSDTDLETARMPPGLGTEGLEVDLSGAPHGFGGVEEDRHQHLAEHGSRHRGL